MSVITNIETLDDLPQPIPTVLSGGPVYLSYPTRCLNCDSFVRLVGEHRRHGNWFCPVCTAYWEYDKLDKPIPWEKRGWKVQSVAEVLVDSSPLSQFVELPQGYDGLLAGESGPRSSSLLAGPAMPWGDPVTANYPMDFVTSFLVPNVGYRIRRKRKYLLSVAEDGTRTGRTKGPLSWGFDLVYTDRSLAEFNTCLSFFEAQAHASPFNFTDPLRGTNHILYFDSEVEADAESFDTVSWGVTLTE
jgi:hypothetical protein